ncbi:hypothetical protein Tco_0142839, partial [Tanacetum coccineum]
MTGNKAYLADFQDFNGGPVAFGGSKGYITGKGKIKTDKLDFEDVDVEDGYVLYLGDDHFALVHEKGSVVLEFSSGKSITLVNV